MTYDQSTEERILQAARIVFQKKGMMGARMQEIADEAGINKAMLHYYFKSKEKLFDKVFLELASHAVPILNKMLSGDMPLFDKIRQFVAEYMNILTANEYMPAFIIQELNREPERLVKMLLSQTGLPNPLPFLMQIQQEAQAGRIRPIAPEQLILNMISLCLFPFLAKPLAKAVGVEDAMIRKVMESRRTEVAEFIINAIKL